MRVLIIFKVLILLSVPWVSSTIQGLSFEDPLNYRLHKSQSTGEDPCNPLYWYPKHIPDYCYYRSTLKSSHIPLAPLPAPIQFSPGFMAPPMPYLPPPYFPIPIPPPLPYGIPLEPTHPMMPVSHIPYASPTLPYNPQNQIGFVPGIPGIVSDDAGINILPFSDAYADMLEKHKQKMIRRRYQKILRDYGEYPWRSRRRHKFS